LQEVFSKWLYIAKIRSIRSSLEPLAKLELANVAEKQESERQFNKYVV
jgi:hypothetical protein